MYQKEEKAIAGSHRFNWQHICALSVLLAGLRPTILRADPLMGNVGAVLNTPYGVDNNPANAGFLRHSQIQLGGDYHSSSAKFRMPGSPTVKNDYSGPGISDVPASVAKINRHWGLGIIGMALNSKVGGKAEGIPLVMLGQLNYMDVDVSINKLNYFRMSNGIQMKDRFGVGFDISYMDVSGEMAGRASGTEGDLFNIRFKNINMINLKVGLRFDVIPQKLMFGVVTNPYYSRRMGSLTFESPMLDTNGAGNTSIEGSMPAVDVGELAGMSTGGFDNWLIGGGAIMGALEIYLDLNYTKKPANTKTFSMSKMKVTEGDYHDVVAARAGGKIHVPKRVLSPFGGELGLMGGLRYEPSSMGPGTAGQDGLAGFNPMMLLATNLTKGPVAMVDDIGSIMGPMGLSSHAPFWSVGGGSELNLWKSRRKHHDERYYRLTLVSGMYLKKESLGVDENGDHPFAYEKNSMGVVGYFIYRF